MCRWSRPVEQDPDYDVGGRDVVVEIVEVLDDAPAISIGTDQMIRTC